MDPHSLFASAAINIGLALFILSLFSILKKYSCNSLIYYARRLANPEERISFNPYFAPTKLLPSFSWIFRAFSVSEDEILQNSGLDVLVVIRLFKFGIKFFLVSSVIGLVILLPVNYTSTKGPVKSNNSHSMDSFTISNIGTGSNRLWVHFSYLCFISFYGCYLLHKADFFMTYILTVGLSGFSLEILQAGLLTWDFLRFHTFGRGNNKNPYLFSFPYYRVIPSVSLSILIGMAYVVIAPLLLPFLIVYFYLGYVVYINQIQDVYDFVYETGGQYWPQIHHYIILSIALMQITMIGLFGLKSKPSALISTIPLFLLTLLFNEYCKMRFRPSFFKYPVQTAVENDERDETDGLIEVESEIVTNAYMAPCLRSISFPTHQSSSIQPLVHSSSSQ